MTTKDKKIIKLNNGVMVTIPIEYKYYKCKCGAEDIIWAITEKNKKSTPIRFDEEKGWISHFADCPLANSFRKK